MSVVKDSSQVCSDGKYRCGSLIYTKAGLFTLFAWLLWGDFSFSLMEIVWPSILPLSLKSLGAPNMVLSLIVVTIPSVMNFILNPIIGTFSDRYRSRFGRRIPFLLISTPFITLFLVLIGFSHQIGRFIHHVMESKFPDISLNALTIALIFVLVISFRFFELFVNTVYWYLFNDVVPAHYIGRFLGLFRVIGSLAGAFFNFVIFRYAESHASWIFLGVALLYGISFFAMCLNVREGEYPAPDPIVMGGGSCWNYVKTFFRECFGHSMFRRVFLFTACWAAAGSIAPFYLFLARSLGLTLEQIGKINGVSLLMAVVLMYPMGVLVDRFHPIRIIFCAQLGLFCLAPVSAIFLIHEFSSSLTVFIYGVSILLPFPFLVAYGASALPMLMRVFPQDKFGQFCAANAMCGAVATVFGGILAGGFLDMMKIVSGGDEFCYRFVPLWSFFFLGLSVITSRAVLIEWKKLGGDLGYRPPVRDKFSTWKSA